MTIKPSATDMAVEIVSAYVGHNSLPSAELPALIQSVHGALITLSRGGAPVEAAREPAVPVRKSVTSEYLICLEDGRKFKSLKRHLRAKFNMSPEEYRAKWNLPQDYPMVAPGYAKARSELAKQMGLGQSSRPAATARAKP
ncbi:MucR family transcriptional regulator [Asticcacaulis sp. AND118]|uniref:MucR family transcriptional regulator n=1 Tax=Asticcacaulis sp. AND118 TaxID=2840468 RepID=UPI001CFFF60A|nr:MucR family transcriptional regulator [Asticcacaulis sp. AND118]UDF03987.1 MucR family transcriptional regulator [Asticcacaulis sp. AND118]